jgi:RNA polymerase I-specific transcription initiation factor RRN3
MAPAVIASPPAIETSSKILPRRSTLVRKREEAELDDENDSAPASPVKKSKVAFNNEVEVQVVEEWDKLPGIIQEEVSRTLQQHLLGNKVEYDKLKRIYAPNTHHDELPSPSTLRYYTKALLSNVAHLNRSCQDLIQSILHSDWIVRDDEYVALFLQFLRYLLSAHGVWVAPTLKMLVNKFQQGQYEFGWL